MVVTIVVLVIGLLALIKGADWLVDGASALAKQFGVPTLVIGLTIVAFGTSMPELLVNVVAAMKWNSDIAFGNVMWSNIANILLILWVTGLITTLKVQKDTTWKEIPFALLAMLVLFVLSNTMLLDGTATNILTKSWGVILLLLFAIFLYYVYESTKKAPDTEDDTPVPSMSYPKMALFIVGGLLGLYFGGTWTVDSAVKIAEYFGLSDFLISTTIIAIGTSLPELVTSVAAARKKSVDLAVGNIIGSNIFNIFWILWVTALIRPIPLPVGANMDLLVGTLATILLFLFMFIGKRHTLQRRQSVLFILLYIVYVVIVIMRG